jgi:hypothetical protein
MGIMFSRPPLAQTVVLDGKNVKSKKENKKLATWIVCYEFYPA